MQGDTLIKGLRKRSSSLLHSPQLCRTSSSPSSRLLRLLRLLRRRTSEATGSRGLHIRPHILRCIGPHRPRVARLGFMSPSLGDLSLRFVCSFGERHGLPCARLQETAQALLSAQIRSPSSTSRELSSLPK